MGRVEILGKQQLTEFRRSSQYRHASLNDG